MKKILKRKIEKLKKEVNSFKEKIIQTTKTKIFWCEVLIITAICSFIVTNFLLNFFVGMYLLSLLLFSTGLFIWKYL